MGISSVWARITGGKRIDRDSVIAAIAKQINQLRMNLSMASSKGNRSKELDAFVLKKGPEKYRKIMAEMQASKLNIEDFGPDIKANFEKIKKILKIS